MRHSKLLVFLLCSTLVLGDTAGPSSGTAAGGSWTSPGNVTASDNVYATKAMAGASGSTHCISKPPAIVCDDTSGTVVPGQSGNISISALGFSIPASSTVLGITATFEHKCSGASACDTDSSFGGKIQLTKTAATGQGTNKGNTTAWETSDSTETLGSGTDLWGSTWTVDEVNASGFGLVVNVLNVNSSTRTAYIDAMALTVTYTPSGSGSHRRVVISQTRSAKLHG
jgi:hypothetical protein